MWIGSQIAGDFGLSAISALAAGRLVALRLFLPTRYQTTRKPKRRSVRSLKVIIRRFAPSFDAEPFFTGVLEGSIAICDADASRVISRRNSFANIESIGLGLHARQRQTRTPKNETAVTGNVSLFNDVEAGFYENVVRSTVFRKSDSLYGAYLQLPAGTIG
jgi:hypothetical protein